MEAARREEERVGKVRIFVGAAPGVGKTYEMLQQARARKQDGYDIVVGVVETHGRKETEALIERIQGDVEKLKEENPSAKIPIDLVTTSASGLDPDISPEAALFQVPRVAKARNMPEDRVRQLVQDQTQGRFLGVLGEPRVNVLALNLALDRAAAR